LVGGHTIKQSPRASPDLCTPLKFGLGLEAASVLFHNTTVCLETSLVFLKKLIFVDIAMNYCNFCQHLCFSSNLYAVFKDSHCCLVSLSDIQKQSFREGMKVEIA